MASKRVFTEDEVEDLIAKVMKHKVSSNKAVRTSAKDEELLREQDAAILRGELASEKKERVRKVARDPTATAADKIHALGGDSSLSPLQLMKLAAPTATDNPVQAHRGAAPPDLLRQVLGNRPSAAELARYSEIAEILAGNVRMGPDRSMVVNNEEVPGDLVKSLRYLIRGTRGYAGPPEGVTNIAALLRNGGIKRSGFPPGIRPLLGGRTRAETAAAGNVTVARRASAPTRPTGAIARVGTPETPRRQLPSLTPSMLDQWRAAGVSLSSDEESEEEQSGSGLDRLRESMNLAELGDHDSAWDSLCLARQSNPPRHLFKQAENYCAHLRDKDDEV